MRAIAAGARRPLHVAAADGDRAVRARRGAAVERSSCRRSPPCSSGSPRGGAGARRRTRVRSGVLALGMTVNVADGAAELGPRPRGRDRHLRRRPPRPSRVIRGRCRRQAWRRPSSRSTRTRARCSGTRSRCSRRSSGAWSCSPSAASRTCSSSSSRERRRARARRVRRAYLRAIGTRGRRRRGGIPLRRRPRGRRRPAASARPRRPAGAARRERLVDAHPELAARLRSRGRGARCSAARSRSTAPSSRATPRRHARLPDREPARRPAASRARATGSTPAPPTASGPRSRSASTRTTAARSGGSRPICSTWRATSTASGSSLELWREAAGRAGVRSEADLVAQIARDVEETRAATRPGVDRKKCRWLRRLSHHMDAAGNAHPLERVRCLDCGTSYAKPADGGTVHENPGCPRCGYLGWIPTSVPSRAAAPDRSGADRAAAPPRRPR